MGTASATSEKWSGMHTRPDTHQKEEGKAQRIHERTKKWTGKRIQKRCKNEKYENTDTPVRPSVCLSLLFFLFRVCVLCQRMGTVC